MLRIHEEREEKIRVEFLKQIPEFSFLSGTLLKKLARELVPEPYHKGKIVYSEGEPCKYLYLVDKGKFRV